jgi:hypothetical protein
MCTAIIWGIITPHFIRETFVAKNHPEATEKSNIFPGSATSHHTYELHATENQISAQKPQQNRDGTNTDIARAHQLNRLFDTE